MKGMAMITLDGWRFVLAAGAPYDQGVLFEHVNG